MLCSSTWMCRHSTLDTISYICIECVKCALWLCVGIHPISHKNSRRIQYIDYSTRQLSYKNGKKGENAHCAIISNYSDMLGKWSNMLTHFWLLVLECFEDLAFILRVWIETCNRIPKHAGFLTFLTLSCLLLLLLESIKLNGSTPSKFSNHLPNIASGANSIKIGQTRVKSKQSTNNQRFSLCLRMAKRCNEYDNTETRVLCELLHAVHLDQSCKINTGTRATARTRTHTQTHTIHFICIRKWMELTTGITESSIRQPTLSFSFYR